MEAIATEARSRDELINGKLDSTIQEAHLPRTGERELKTKQIELQTQISQANIRLQELGQMMGQARANRTGQGEAPSVPPGFEARPKTVEHNKLVLNGVYDRMCQSSGYSSFWHFSSSFPMIDLFMPCLSAWTCQSLGGHRKNCRESCSVS